MAIQFRNGLEANLDRSKLLAGEPAYCTDSKKMVVGNGDGTADTAMISALAAYPVGSIYMSVSPADPATLLGGTWAAWGQGRVPVGIGSNGTTDYETVEATGGEDKHALTSDENGPHAHTVTINSGATSTATTWGSTATVPVSGNCSLVTASSGSGTAHENRQPYITCYMWKRTA